MDRKEWKPDLVQEKKPGMQMPEVPVSDTDLKGVAELVQELLSTKDQLALAEQQVSDLKERSRRLSEEDIPAAMDNLGMTSFTLEHEGVSFKVGVGDFVRAHIKDDAKDAAFRWLEEHNADGIIKGDVKIGFNRGDRGIVNALLGLVGNPQSKEMLSALRTRGFDELADTLAVIGGAKSLPEVNEGIHWKTLNKFVKDTLADPEIDDFPRELFGIHQGRTTTIKQ